jgi:glycosyltransferase involved in cell wall biosynthesis
MTESPLRVLHLNTERGYRGGEIQTLLLARELRKRGHVNVLAVPRGTVLADHAAQDGFDTHAFPMRGEWDVAAALRLRALVRGFRPHVLHAHTPHAGALALLARMGGRSPKIVLSRRVSVPIKGNFLSRLKYKSADAVLCVSQAVLGGLLAAGLPSEKLFLARSSTNFEALIPSASRSEIRARLGIPPASFVVGNVAHFDRHKGQRRLLEAFAVFCRKRQGAESSLLLAGKGPLLEECRRYAAAVPDLAGRVFFAGESKIVADMYAVMDVFFLSTISPMEGWSGVLREAMGLGLPAIATDQPSNREAVSHGETGWLVPPDDAAAWAQAMAAMASDPALRLRLGEAGKLFARRFTVEAMADETLRCYRSVLARGGHEA